MHLFSKAWIFSFLKVSKQGPCFIAVEEDGGDKLHLELELACKADSIALPYPVWSGHCCHKTSPLFHMVGPGSDVVATTTAAAAATTSTSTTAATSS